MISVERHLQFQDPEQGNLTYSEYWPAHEHKERQICNCTKEVAVRPAGEPAYVGQDIVLSGPDWDFRLASMWMTFRWKNASGKAPFDPHAYFTFGNEGRSVHIEVVEPYQIDEVLNPKKVFLGSVYMGALIDTSELMNGHSPSRVIDLSRIDPNDIWMHHCNFGKEAMDFLKGPESTFWSAIFTRTQDIFKWSRTYLDERQMNVHQLHGQVEKHQNMVREVDALSGFLHTMARMEKFQTSKAYELGVRLNNQTSDLTCRKCGSGGLSPEDGRMCSECRNRTGQD